MHTPETGWNFAFRRGLAFSLGLALASAGCSDKPKTEGSLEPASEEEFGSIARRLTAADRNRDFEFVDGAGTDVESRGVAFDSANNRIVIADINGDRILMFNTANNFGCAGAPTCDVNAGDADLTLGNAGPAGTTLSNPSDVAVSANGDLFVSDTSNNRVLVYFAPFRVVGGDIVPDAVIGQANFTGVAANRGGATAADGLSAPTGIYFSGTISQGAGTGTLWVADSGNNRVLRYSLTFAGFAITAGGTANRVLGQANFTANGAATTQTGISLANATPGGDVFVDGTGFVYVADTFNNRVLRYENVAADGPAATRVFGQLDFVTQAARQQADGTADDPAPDVDADATGITAPRGVAVDGDGNIYIADNGYNRVLGFYGTVTTNTNIPTEVFGQANFNAIAGGAGVAGLNGPWGLAVDVVVPNVSGGNLFVGDITNDRVVNYRVNNAPTIAVANCNAGAITSQGDALPAGVAAATCTAATNGDCTCNVFEGDGVTLNFTTADTEANNLTMTTAAAVPTGSVFTAVNGVPPNAGTNLNWTTTRIAFNQANTYAITVRATETNAVGSPNLVGTRLVTIIVAERNRAPTITANPAAAGAPPAVGYTVNEGVALSINLQGSDANDSPDTGVLYTAFNGLGCFSTAAVPAGLTVSAGGVVSWTPTFAQGGNVVGGNTQYSVSFRARDGGSTGGASDPKQACFSTVIQVNHVNQAPVLTAPANQTANEGATTTFSLAATDFENAAITYLGFSDAGCTVAESLPWLTVNAGTGLVTMTPTFTDSGTYTVRYRVNDPIPANSACLSHTITVNNVNQAPTLAFNAIGGQDCVEVGGAFAQANGDVQCTITNFGPGVGDVQFDLVGADADVTDTFTYSAANAPAGTFTAGNGQFRWTPVSPGDVGVRAMTFTVTDNNGAMTSRRVVVSVGAVSGTPVNLTVNDPAAVAQTNCTGSTGANTACTRPFTSGVAVALNEGGALNLTLVGNNGTGPYTFSKPAGTVGAIAGANFSYAPGFTEAGTYTVDITVTDSSNPAQMDTERLNITVTAANRAPVLAAIGNRTVNENGLLTFAVSCTDADNDTLTLSIDAPADQVGNPLVNASTYFTDNGNGTGTFSWQTDFDDNVGSPFGAGPGAFPGSLVGITFRCADGISADDGENIQITVTDVGRAPALTVLSAGQLQRTAARVATTANIAALAGGAPDPVDGVALAVGDRVLVKDQAALATNGIYEVITVGGGANGTWQRTTDANEADEFPIGLWVNVTAGTVGAGTNWVLGNNTAIVVGTSDINWLQVNAGATAFSSADVNCNSTAAPTSCTMAEGGALRLVTIASDLDADVLTLTCVGSLCSRFTGTPFGAAGTNPIAAFTAQMFTFSPTPADATSYSMTFSVTDGTTPVATTLALTVNDLNQTPTQAFGVVGVPDAAPAIACTNPALPAPQVCTGVDEGAAVTVTLTGADGDAADTLANANTANTLPNVTAGPTFTADTNGALENPEVSTLTFTMGANAATADCDVAGDCFARFTTTDTHIGAANITVTRDIQFVAQASNNAPVITLVNNAACRLRGVDMYCEIPTTGASVVLTVEAVDADNPADSIDALTIAALPNGCSLDTDTTATINAPFINTDRESDARRVITCLAGTVNPTFAATTITAIDDRGGAAGTSTFLGQTGGNLVIVGLADNVNPVLTFNVAGDSSIDENAACAARGAPLGAAQFLFGGGTVTLEDLGASFPTDIIGKTVTIAAATSAGNNGTFTIATRPSATQITFANAAGVAEAFAAATTYLTSQRTAFNCTITTGQILTFQTPAVDFDGDALTFTAAREAGGALGGGTPTNDTFTGTTYSYSALAADNNPTCVLTTNGCGVRVTVADGQGGTTNVTVRIQVNVNNAPVVTNPGNQNGSENVTMTFPVTANDADLANTVTIGATGLPTGATFTGVAGNPTTYTFTWTPTLAQGGIYNVTFTPVDNQMSSGTPVTITITIFNVNQPPVLAAIGNRPNQTVLTALTISPTCADSDTGDTLTMSAVGTPSGATFTDNGAGSATFNWTPTVTQTGNFSITFTCSDGIASDSETIQITVANPGQGVVITVTSPQTVNEGEQLIFQIRAVSGNGLPVNLTATGVPTGAVYLQPSPAADVIGTFQWTPSFAQSGPYIVTFTASDGQQTDAVGVTINVTDVNRAPVLTAIGNRTVAENTLLSFNVVATDPDGTAPTLSAAPLPANATFTGGVFSWQPDFMQQGTYTITFTASDGTLTDSENVVVSVTNTNRAPVLSPAGPFTVAEGGNLTFTLAATDADSDPLSYSAVGSPTGAQFSGGVFAWVPDFTQSGTYNVTFTVSDGAATDSEVVMITATNVNRAPVFTPVAAIGVEPGERVSFSVQATDPDGDTVTYGLQNQPTGATFDATGLFDWVPTDADVGTYMLQFTATDNGTPTEVGMLAVNVTVRQGNRPPVLNPINDQTVAENASLTFTVSASDPDGDPVRFSANGLPQGATFNGVTGAFSWTPTYDQAGDYEVSILATDSFNDESTPVTVTIRVTNTNRPPVITPIAGQSVNETKSVSFTVSATDPDGDEIRYAFTSQPGLPMSSGALNATSGVFNYTAPNSSAGTYTLTITATDNGTPAASGTTMVTLRVIAGDGQPPVVTVPSQVSGEEGAEGGISFMVTVSDPDGGSVTLAATGVPLSDLGATFDATAGLFQWTEPKEGEYTITITATDDSGLTTTVTVTIVVDAGGCSCATADSTDGVDGTSVPVLVGLLGLVVVGRRRRRK